MIFKNVKSLEWKLYGNGTAFAGQAVDGYFPPKLLHPEFYVDKPVAFRWQCRVKANTIISNNVVYALIFLEEGNRAMRAPRMFYQVVNSFFKNDEQVLANGFPNFLFLNIIAVGKCKMDATGI